jgi:hypothetical protein
MTTQLVVGILLNTLAFGAMGFARQKLGIKTPAFLQNDIVSILITVVYAGSFFVILLSPGSWLLKIAICLGMQFLVNHLIWGVITGVVAGIGERKRRSAILSASEASHQPRSGRDDLPDEPRRPNSG